MKQALPMIRQLAAVLTMTLSFAWTLNLGAGELYWTEFHPVSRLQTSDADGGNISPIITSGLGIPLHTDVDPAGGKIYWSELGAIRRADLNGSNVEAIFSTPSSSPNGLALDTTAGKIYWTLPSENKIQRSNLNGTSVEDVITTSASPISLAIDPGGSKVYWSEEAAAGDAVIRRSNLNGTGSELLVTLGADVIDASGIALDLTNQKLYWGESTTLDTGLLWNSNLNGSGASFIIASGLSEIQEIALDVAGGKLYWTQPDLATIQRSNLNGTSLETVVTLGTAVPVGLAFLTSTGGPCDFNTSSTCDITDINLMFAQGNLVAGVAVGGGNQFDLNSDLTINNTDITAWLSNAAVDNSFPTPYQRGDTDLDRKVDITDFNALATNFAPTGAVPAPGFDKGNSDGDDGVDITDFNFLAINFAPTGYGGQGISIPEPASLTLFGMASLLLWIQSRRRRT